MQSTSGRQDARLGVRASRQTSHRAGSFSWAYVASVIAAGLPSGTPSRSMSAARAGCVASRSPTRPPSKQLGTKPGAIVQQKSDHLPPGTSSAACHTPAGTTCCTRAPREDVAAEHDLLVRAVRVQQHEAQRVARVEVPHLVERQPVEERPARRVVAEQAEACRSRRAAVRRDRVALVRLGEERSLDRERRHAEPLDDLSHGGSMRRRYR